MTPQEQQLIENLIARIQKTPVPEKDHDAEQLLQQGLGSNPDALYLLAQTVIVQGYALEQAQRQLAAARTQLQSAQQQSAQQEEQPRHTSFLSTLFGSGHEDKNTAPPPRPAPPQPQYSQPPAQPQYAPVPGYTQVPPSYPPQYQPQPSGGGGFLRGALQTASGVAAGALAFQGIESLMHGFGHATGYGDAPGFFGGGAGMGGGAPREEIINNYYGDASPGEQHHGDLGSGSFSDPQNSSADFSSSGLGSTGDFGNNSGENNTLFQNASYADPAGDTDNDTGTNDDNISYPDDSTYGNDNLDMNDTSDDSGSFDSGGDDTTF